MIIEWIVIAIFIIVGLVFLKIEHHTRKYKALIIIIIGFLLYFSIVGIFSSQEVDLTSPRGIVNSIYLYFGWMGKTTSTLWDIGVDTTHLVGNAIKINNSEKNIKPGTR